MASSSSSAVLELQDADTTDTEAASVTDDAHEAAPLIMQHGQDIAVKVDSPMKQLSTLETFVTYRVRCVCARWPTPPHVRRRYNHFKLLHKRLSVAHPLIAAPALPPLHSARQQLDRYSATFVAVRALALNAFLDRVARHPILTHSDDLRLFMTTPDEEFDKVFKSENSALNLWGLSNALYSSGESKPTNGARVKDPEFTAAADYMQSLQQKLSTLCVLTTKLYKGSVSLSTEFMGMRRACDAWAVQAGGRAARAAAACGAGAAGAANARARAPLRHRAALPLLAAYAAAHLDKIRARDTLHAAYVSSSNATDELHNRLEQASEALRSELLDWVPKTRTEIKSLLLDLADKQLNIHSQTLMSWEHALKLSTETDVHELFKTVSKTAVQNLSPSKCRADMTTPTETERDFDDLEIENYDDDSDIQDVSKLQDSDAHGVLKQDLDVQDSPQTHGRSHLDNSAALSNNAEIRNGNSEVSATKSDSSKHDKMNNIFVTELDIHSSDVDPKNEDDPKTNDAEFEKVFDQLVEESDSKLDSISKDESLKSDGSKTTDPLQDFSEVDLS